MSATAQTIEKLISQEYKQGFVTDLETDTIPPGLSEDVIRIISGKKANRIGCCNGAWRRIATG